ncbi:protein COFACTOR ASSEMBLY OF COMPLEX C SUBUNIT B CCB3, chloroplastic-like [Triticum dicoccoides]|uniref:Protein COFACTOR ASSEMBLY OF COMPLEX C SUBUNIT B CCB3, chloroplastic n=1 Tax=Triticum aestivum TaxID=4565 RepID=A0A3B6ESP0_WHEAT|nr:protein COFACTOR ASSEMBLY OF COMPLEX C SUBUNIT B CCB3, chloroplastic-like [Triticum dicoccoides]
MEASMLKPSVLLSPARGRGCVVAGAGGRGSKNLETRRPEGSEPARGAHGHVLPLAAAAVSSSAAALPCHAATSPAAYEQSLYRAAVVLGELDPATAKVVIGVAGPALSAVGFLFVARIVMSWYPRLPVTKFPYVVAYAPTEPILAATRRVIPPLGGVDVTPVVWFGLVSFLSEILVGPQGLLVLLSQQVSPS